MITDDKLDAYFDKHWKDDNMDNFDKNFDRVFKFSAIAVVLYLIGFAIFWGAVIFAILKLANHYG